MKYSPRFLKTPQGKLVFIVAIIVGLLLGYYFYAVPKSNDQGDTVAITISEADHIKGSVNGKVTVVEFGDFQCPACGAYEPIVRQVYSDNKDSIKLVYKHFPLVQIHKNALPAAKAAEAAGMQGKFWEMHDMLYDKQEEWGNSLNSRDYFLSYATTLGLNTDKLIKDMEDPALEDKILAEFREGVKLGVQGTPTFYVNGKQLKSPVNLAEFNKAIKEAAINAVTASSTAR